MTNIVLIISLSLILYICIFEDCPLNPYIILHSVINIKKIIIKLIRINKNNTVKEHFKIEKSEKKVADNKIKTDNIINFDYNSKPFVKRSITQNFPSWYDNSYIESYNEDTNTRTLKTFNDQSTCDIIYNNDRYEYDYNNPLIYDKPVHEIYDSIVNDNYSIK